MSELIESPIQFFTGTNGKALENGKIYIGVAGLDAEANPQQVYFDAAATIPAAQPIRTTAGFPSSGGSVQRLFNGATFSITVRDQNDVLIYSVLDVGENSDTNFISLYGAITLDDVAAVIDDTTLTYTAGKSGTVTTGDYVRTRAEGFAYEVAASDASDQHVTTAGGVKLYALASSSGQFNLAQFGASPVALFDNGPALRTARRAAEAHGSDFASAPIVVDAGTYEVRTAEADASAAVRFQKAPNIIGKGTLSTVFHWYTATENQPFFLVDPAVATACWGIQMSNFAVWANLGDEAGSAIKIEMTSPSATFGTILDSVRVVGCYDGITTSNVGGTTIYGAVIKNCSIEGIISGGKGFNIAGAYMEVDNCEGYPAFDGSGETSFTFYLTSGWSKYRNLRAAGPVFADAPDSEFDLTMEGQGSTCAHNGNAAIRINRMKAIRAVLLGARITGETLPRYGLNLQDTNYTLEYMRVQDLTTFSSPITPMVGGGSGRNTLLLAEASGVGVLKPENDIETGLDPTQGGKWQIINGGSYTDYGEWTSVFNPPSIAAGASAVTTVTCAGLRTAAPVAAQFSIVNADIDVSAKYLSATQIQVRFSNRGASPVDLAEGTITVRALIA